MPKKPTVPRTRRSGTSAPDVQQPVDRDAGEAGRLAFPIAAVGGSAGGIQAVIQLLEGLPGRTRIAFVLLQHTSPNHEEALEAVMARASGLAVATVVSGMVPEPDRIYLAPAGQRTTLAHGAFKVEPFADTTVAQGAIDAFMGSLASEHGVRSIAVIL